jgi:hypothetical protein
MSNVVLTNFPEMKMSGSVDKVWEGGRLAFSPDSKKLAISAKQAGLIHNKGGAYIWDIAENKLHKHIAKDAKHCCDMFAFSHDGSKLVTAYRNGFDIWDVKSGNKLTSIVTDPNKKGFQVTRSIAFNADGNKIARIIQYGKWGKDRKRKVDLWDINSKKLLMSFSEQAPKGKLSDKREWKFMIRPWDAMIHPKLGIVLLKYDSIYPNKRKVEEKGTSDPFSIKSVDSTTNISPNLKISIWRLEKMTKLFRE